MWPIAMVALALLQSPDAEAGTRAKDVGEFLGVRDNPLTGAGLVVGLSRTGDSTQNEAAIRALATRLQGLGVTLELEDIRARNVALVMVSATLGPGQRPGSRIDVTVASTGDATSLDGGFLLLTPLVGADGEVYALGEGPLVVGGYAAESGGASTRRNNSASGRVVGGAIVERDVANAPDYGKATTAEFVLDRPDFTTAERLATAIDTQFGTEVAEAASPSTIELTLPAAFQGKFASFAATIEAVELDVDEPARVVISERTGTVVMGADVQIAPVAVAHGGLTIEVRKATEASQPPPLSLGTTVTTTNTTVTAEDKPGELVLVEGTNIGELVTALNKMGVTPRDLIVILQAIRTAGALHAEIVAI